MGRKTDAVDLFAEFAAAPYRQDFYQALRRVECAFGDFSRWGEAPKPADEAIRLGQEPELTFAPAAIASFEMHGDAPPRMGVRHFGLLGPNGPLPLHLTEYIRDRVRDGDPTFSRFLDIFHQRFLALFYRAWAQAQPHVNHDRPNDDRFTVYVGAFVGLAPSALRDRDAVPDLAKLFHAGSLVRQPRNAEGLASILTSYFGVAVRLREFVGHWMPLAASERTRLARAGAELGMTAVLGDSVWDRQHKFRIEIGPLDFGDYESFLPGGGRLEALVAWVRQYMCFELAWDVGLFLRQNEVPQLKLGKAGRLGWTTWLGHRPEGSDAGDLCLDAEAFVDRDGVHAA